MLHGDLKSANVLVKGEFDEIKLCDFGVTLPLNDAGEVNQEGGKNQYIGTEPWSAKEVIEEETISTKVCIKDIRNFDFHVEDFTTNILYLYYLFQSLFRLIFTLWVAQFSRC